MGSGHAGTFSWNGARRGRRWFAARPVRFMRSTPRRRSQVERSRRRRLQLQACVRVFHQPMALPSGS